MENEEWENTMGNLFFWGDFMFFVRNRYFFSVDYRYPRFILKKFSGKIKEQNKLSATSSYEVYFRK